jgi:hypothetical protein
MMMMMMMMMTKNRAHYIYIYAATSFLRDSVLLFGGIIIVALILDFEFGEHFFHADNIKKIK